MNIRKKNKVLLVSPYSSKIAGGICTWSKIVLDYCKEQKDCEIIFLNTVQGLPKRWALNYKFTHLLIGLIDSLLIIIRLFWRMMVSRPDVVHYTSSAALALYKDSIALWIVKRLFKKRFIIHWHFGRIPIVFVEKGKEYNRFINVCNKADFSIAIDMRSYLTLKNEDINAVYIPNPIPIALQHEAEILKLEEVATGRNEGEILFVGQALDTKGIMELVRACASTEQVKKLTIVGPFFDDNFKKTVVKNASIRNNGNWLRLVGEKKREDVWEYYKKCSLFCLPSYTEGFPYVILEAMAFACPIVATNVGAIPEMLSGNCGELVEPRTIEPLNKSIEKLLKDSNKAKMMGERAHTKVLEEYTVEKVYSEYENLWKNASKHLCSGI